MFEDDDEQPDDNQEASDQDQQPQQVASADEDQYVTDPAALQHLGTPQQPTQDDSQYVTDPDLLKQLGTPDDGYVNDPALLAQLGTPDQPAPEAEGIFGTIARQYAHQILPTAAAIGAGVLAAPLGLGAIPVAVGTYMGASKLQDEGLKALGIDDNAKMAADAAAHPVASAVGDIAMAATPWGIGSDIALARRGLGAAVGTAVEGYNQYQQGQFDPTRLAVAAGTGAIFNKPRAGTAALEGALGSALGRGAAAAPAAPTAPTADIPEPVPPAQGQLPGIGGGERQPELPLDTSPPAPGKQPLAPGEYEPQLPFEPPTIDEQGQYGFHGITADPMPETGGVAKESTPPPAGDQPRNNAWRYAKDKPIRDEGGGTNVLQPGQVDPAIALVVSPPQTSTPEIDAAVSRAIAPEPSAAAAAAARPPDTVSQAPAVPPRTAAAIATGKRTAAPAPTEDLNTIPDFLQRNPARRSAVEQAASRPGGLPAATEALMQRIDQRIDDINSGRVQPGPGEVQRLAITRAQLNARRAGAAPAAPAARPQVRTHDGGTFTGATVPEAAARAAAAGYRPHQIFNTDGTPYTAPRPGAASTAAPPGRAPPGGTPPRGPTPPAGATPPAGKGATVKSTLAPAMKSDLQTGVLASLRRNLGGLVMRGSESAQKAQTALRNAIGPLARLKEQTLHRFTNEMHRLGNSMDKPAFERFVDAYESGRVSTLPKDQQELGNVFAKNYGDFLKEINNRPGVEQMEGVKNYLTHMYDNSNGQVDKFASDWYGGGGGSLKQRTHPTFADARAAELQPLSHNPIEHFTRYSEGISHYLAQRNMMADLENQHVIGHFGPKAIGASGAPEPQVRGEPPEGYSKIDIPWAQKNGRQAYAPRDIAETINQFYNKGLQRAQTKDIYNFLQQTKNMWTAVELGFSGYHALTVGVESMASGQARALQLAGSGRYAEAAAQLLKTPAEPVTSYLYGRTGRQIYRDTTGTVGDPTARKIIGYFAKANIQPGNLKLTGEYDMSRLGNLWDSYKRGSLMNEFQAQLKSISDSYGLKLPAVLLENVRRAVQTLSKPLFEHYIPELKLGTMMKDMEAWMGSNPNATEEQSVAYAQRIADSIDNRMGEMNYDNMFINKTAINLGTLGLRSFGFTVGGPFREIGAGAGRLGLTAAQGKNPLSHLDLRSAAADPRTAYALAYLPTIAAIGAVYQLLRTGKGPEDWRDLITPKTGGTVKSVGKMVPERMEPPGYQKDFLGYFIKPYVDPEATPLDELKAKMAAPWTALWEQLTGKDWRNQKYVPPRATTLESLKAHAQQLGSHMLPIGPKQLAEGRKPGSQLTIPEQMLGVRTPGAYMLNPKGLEQFLSQKQQRDYAADRKRQGLPPRPLPPAPR